LILQKCKTIKVENGIPAGKMENTAAKRPGGEAAGKISPYDTGFLENPAGKTNFKISQLISFR